jgi:hypothetical protein
MDAAAPAKRATNASAEPAPEEAAVADTEAVDPAVADSKAVPKVASNKAKDTTGAKDAVEDSAPAKLAVKSAEVAEAAESGVVTELPAVALAAGAAESAADNSAVKADPKSAKVIKSVQAEDDSKLEVNASLPTAGNTSREAKSGLKDLPSPSTNVSLADLTGKNASAKVEMATAELAIGNPRIGSESEREEISMANTTAKKNSSVVENEKLTMPDGKEGVVVLSGTETNSSANTRLADIKTPLVSVLAINASLGVNSSNSTNPRSVPNEDSNLIAQNDTMSAKDKGMIMADTTTTTSTAKPKEEGKAAAKTAGKLSARSGAKTAGGSVSWSGITCLVAGFIVSRHG